MFLPYLYHINTIFTVTISIFIFTYFINTSPGHLKHFLTDFMNYKKNLSPSLTNRRRPSTPTTSAVRRIISSTVENATEVTSIPSAATPKQRHITDMVEKAAGTSNDEQQKEPAAQDSTQDPRISTYTEEEKIEFKDELSQHFGADDEQESRKKSYKLSNGQAQQPPSGLH